MSGCRVRAAEGLQEVETNKISTTQLRNIIKAKKIHKEFNINIKSLCLYQFYQYAAFAFLKHKIVQVTDRWTHNLSLCLRRSAMIQFDAATFNQIN